MCRGCCRIRKENLWPQKIVLGGRLVSYVFLASSRLKMHLPRVSWANWLRDSSVRMRLWVRRSAAVTSLDALRTRSSCVNFSVDSC